MGLGGTVEAVKVVTERVHTVGAMEHPIRVDHGYNKKNKVFDEPLDALIMRE